jgi:nucleotide-binding universal stress UspA family protein
MNHPDDILAGAPVVVGTDGSDHAIAAVGLAATEADLRHRPLVIMHAIPWPTINEPYDSDLATGLDRHLRAEADRIVADATTTARRTAADVEIREAIRVDSSTGFLINASERASLLVVGGRGHGGIAGLLLGSTANHVSAHAHCPVMIARGKSTPLSHIVLGVDGSPASAEAVAFAFEEASLRSAPLTAVHAWRHPKVRAPGDMLPLVYDVDDIEHEERRVLAEALAGWRERYPDVAVDEVLVRGGTRAKLLDASAGAQLLVVGARTGQRWTGVQIGSTSQAMASRAHCPVAIVGPRR